MAEAKNENGSLQYGWVPLKLFIPRGQVLMATAEKKPSLMLGMAKPGLFSSRSRT